MAFFVAGLFRLRQVYGADMRLPKAEYECVQEVACLQFIIIILYFGSRDFWKGHIACCLNFLPTNLSSLYSPI